MPHPKRSRRDAFNTLADTARLAALPLLGFPVQLVEQGFGILEIGGVEALREPVVNPREHRSAPTVGIGTELLTHREKIEVRPTASPVVRSPVPMRCADPRCTRALCAFSRRMPKT
jgi:hypothetical protein